MTLVDDAANSPFKGGTFISKDGMRYTRRGFSRMQPVKLAIGAETRKLRLEECRRELAGKEKAYRLVQNETVACRSIKKLQNQNQNMDEFFANVRILLDDSGKLQGLHEKNDLIDSSVQYILSPPAGFSCACAAHCPTPDEVGRNIPFSVEIRGISLRKHWLIVWRYVTIFIRQHRTEKHVR